VARERGGYCLETLGGKKKNTVKTGAAGRNLKKTTRFDGSAAPEGARGCPINGPARTGLPLSTRPPPQPKGERDGRGGKKKKDSQKPGDVKESREKGKKDQAKRKKNRKATASAPRKITNEHGVKAKV